MRLTNPLRAHVANAAAAKACPADRLKLGNLEKEIVKLLRKELIPPHIAKLLAPIPAQYLSCETLFSVGVPRSKNRYSVYIPHDDPAAYGMPTVRNYVAKDPDLITSLHERARISNRITKRSDEVRKAAYGVLYRCNTVNQLRAAWPEVDEFLPPRLRGEKQPEGEPTKQQVKALRKLINTST